MTMPVRSLPTIQRWDCQSCSDCCRSYAVGVTEAERERLLAQNWEGIVPTILEGGGHRLNHRADGACVFLDDDNRCRIHAKFGEAAKPMACRIYPFVLVPAGDHWRVGMRFACPSVAKNQGRPLAEHAASVNDYAALVEADAGDAVANTPTPPLQTAQAVAWNDLHRFRAAILKLWDDVEAPIELRLRRAVALAAVCRKSRFDKVQGDRLGVFLEVISAAVVDETTADPAAVPPPSWIGRMVFRQLAAIYGRKDNGPDKGLASTSRWFRIRSAMRYARGQGKVPRLHARVPDVRFAEVERPTGPLPREAEELLARYFRVKVDSMQFCGPSLYGFDFWDGFDALALTFPVILWLGRVFAAGGMDRNEALRLALRSVDDHFGFNKLLGARRQLWAVRTLCERGEIAKLIAWYGR
jgi:lysine-N-methylase